MGLLRDRTLLITPGDREDLLLAAVAANRAARSAPPKVSGLILTGGFRPAAPVLTELRSSGLFAYLVGDDTYRTAQAVDAILVKTHPTDTEKIYTIVSLVGSALDVGGILARLDPPLGSHPEPRRRREKGRRPDVGTRRPPRYAANSSRSDRGSRRRGE